MNIKGMTFFSETQCILEIHIRSGINTKRCSHKELDIVVGDLSWFGGVRVYDCCYLLVSAWR